jgi:hypothetical protein
MGTPYTPSGSAAASYIYTQPPTEATTLVWGTEGTGFSSPGSAAGYIVVSANESLRVEEIDIEQGSGFEAIVILLNKGVDIELEVIDDLSVTPPAIGTVATLSSPFGNGLNVLIVQSKANQARKREGMRTITCKSYNAITLS